MAIGRHEEWAGLAAIRIYNKEVDFLQRIIGNKIDTNHIPQVVFSEVQAVVVHRATVGYLAENDLQDVDRCNGICF